MKNYKIKYIHLLLIYLSILLIASCSDIEKKEVEFQKRRTDSLKNVIEKQEQDYKRTENIKDDKIKVIKEKQEADSLYKANIIISLDTIEEVNSFKTIGQEKFTQIFINKKKYDVYEDYSSIGLTRYKFDLDKIYKIILPIKYFEKKDWKENNYPLFPKDVYLDVKINGDCYFDLYCLNDYYEVSNTILFKENDLQAKIQFICFVLEFDGLARKYQEFEKPSRTIFYMYPKKAYYLNKNKEILMYTDLKK